jgi:hypothetical protein
MRLRGEQMVKLVPLDAPEPSPSERLGSLAGQVQVRDDFDTMGSAEIERLFSVVR